VKVKVIHHVTLEGLAVGDFDLVKEHHRCISSVDVIRTAIASEARRIRAIRITEEREKENALSTR